MQTSIKLSISDQFEIRQTITFRLNHSLPFHTDPEILALAAIAPDVKKLVEDDRKLWAAKLAQAEAATVADAVKMKAKLGQLQGKTPTVAEIVAESKRKGRAHNAAWQSAMGFHPGVQF